MKAAGVRSFDEPLAIEDVPVPEPGPEQVLVHIEASGLCRTDIHAARGEWPVKPAPPFIPGHEGVGIVERMGEGNPHGLEPGMRAALPWLGYPCGDCRYCNSGRETLCPGQMNTGYSMDGGFAEYAAGPARRAGARGRERRHRGGARRHDARAARRVLAPLGGRQRLPRPRRRGHGLTRR